MSSRNGPIIIIEDDNDDQEMLRDALTELKISNKLIFFNNSDKALYYLMDTKEQPFLILCDINMPLLNGLEFRRKIVEIDLMRKKTIPFVFLTTTSKTEAVEEAYNLMVQGFFQKPNSMKELKELLHAAINYWKICLHPNV